MQRRSHRTQNSSVSKTERGWEAERPSSRIPFTMVEENRVQRGQALGPTAHSKALYGLAPACSHSLPYPIPQPACWVFLLMLEWATLGPASGPLHLLFVLPRMLSAHPTPHFHDRLILSGLNSDVPSEGPSLSILTSVAHTSCHTSPRPRHSSQQINFPCSNYDYRKLFIYLFASYYPLVCLGLCYTPST